MTRLVIVLMLLCAPALSSAKNLGIVGKTYPFAEHDALAEIEERARKVDWNKQLAGLKKRLVKFRPETPDLPRVVADRVRLVDPTYTLEVDVPDPRNPSQILYPKGFTFNPFQYMTMPGCVVFVDVGDKKQLAWLQKNKLVREGSTRVLLTGGDTGQMEEMFRRPFFYADDILVDRFGIMAVPSTACQKGASIEVHEFLP